MKPHDRVAWCATFANLYGFEVDCASREAMTVALTAYQLHGELAPATALQMVLQMPLTWPRTGAFETEHEARRS